MRSECPQRSGRLRRTARTLALALAFIPAGAAHADLAFAPYADVALWPPIDLALTARESGAKKFTLAFVQSNGSCSPHWAGIIPIADHHMGKEIDALRSQGGDVVISFGGAAGISLAEACDSLDALTAAYRTVIDRYQVDSVDFDVEGAAIVDSVSIARRSAAIARLQAAMAYEGRYLSVSLTLPVLPTGLVWTGLEVVRSARDAGVDVSTVNIMTMDYGDAAAPNPSGKMGAYAIAAARNLHAQLSSLYPSLSPTELWKMVGMTPMIGQNDVASEILTVEEAAEIAKFAKEAQIGRLSMWSVHRDRPCAGGASPWASPICSGIDAPRFAFVDAFLGGSPASPSPGPGPTNPSTPPGAPAAGADLELTRRLTSDWGGGYCTDVSVTNRGPTPVDWNVHFEVEGVVSTLWSAAWSQEDNTVRAQGLAWNRTLTGGGAASFGFCATRVKPTPRPTTPPTPPDAPPPSATLPYADGLHVVLQTTSDWGHGYCADVRVENQTATELDWRIVLEVEGSITSLWNADWTQDGSRVRARGRTWNATLFAGGSTTFGFCSAR